MHMHKSTNTRIQLDRIRMHDYPSLDQIIHVSQEFSSITIEYLDPAFRTTNGTNKNKRTARRNLQRTNDPTNVTIFDPELVTWPCNENGISS